jgi:hypothetical protein
MIDSATSRLALRVAEAATRRDVSSRAVNGVLAAARMLAGAMGSVGSSWVSVDVRGVFATMTPSCRFVEQKGCQGDRWCVQGDPMGCNIKGEHQVPVWGLVAGVPGADMPPCPRCDTRAGSRNPCTGDTPVIKKWWSCCCNNRLTVCVDCTTKRNGFTCICAYQAGKC